MRQFSLTLVAISACSILPSPAGLVAAEPREAPVAEAQQLRDELNELRQFLQQVSERLDGMEKRLSHLEATQHTRIHIVPYPNRQPPWYGIEAGMMLDALEHQQRFGPRAFGNPSRFEPRRLGEPFSVPRLETPRK